MKKILLLLLTFLVMFQAPAEASLKHKVKAVALFPVRIIACAFGGAAVGISAALFQTMWQWDGEPPL